MEDRYLFKTKQKNTNEWAIGNLIHTFTGMPYIVTEYDHILNSITIDEVDERTVCQCTGLKDKNGNMMYENDIVKRTDKPKAGEPTIGIIEYDIANTAFIIRWLDVPNYSPTFPWKEKIEVIGNKFDNKDLLEKEFF
jgi:yopX protein